MDQKEQPLAVYGWAILLSITSVAAALCLIGAGPVILLAVTTLLCLAVALPGAIVVGFTLTTARNVIRAALIGAAVLSLNAVLIPIAVVDAINPACKTLNCDLGPSLGGAAIFVASALIFFVLMCSGYRLRMRQLSHHSDQ